MIGVVVAVVLGGAGLWACGGDDGDRDEQSCNRCTIGIDQGCFSECRGLCLPDDPNCEPRCAAQCDQCRRDLVCGACVGNCAADAPTRCAPSNATIECQEGTYGGFFPEPPE